MKELMMLCWPFTLTAVFMLIAVAFRAAKV